MTASPAPTSEVFPPINSIWRIEHDDFVGKVVGSYQTAEGKKGVALQQLGTRIVHVYSLKWLKPATITPVDCTVPLDFKPKLPPRAHHDPEDWQIDWHGRFLGLACHVAGWSKDPSTKVGCVIVDEHRRVVSVGFNGFPRGVADDHRLDDRATKYDLTIHAEINALMFAGRSVRGCTVYVWPMPPCVRCATQLIQAGVRCVVAPPPEERWAQSCNAGTAILNEAGVSTMTLGIMSMPMPKDELTEIDRLQAHLNKLEAEVKELKHQNAEMQDENAKLEAKLALTEDGYDGLTKAIQDRDRQLAVLRTQRDMLKGDVNGLKWTRDSLERKNGELKVKLNNADAEINDLKLQVHDLKQQLRVHE